MKVILLKDIENIGKKYEVKEIKPGYARNFLIPKGLAKLATEKNLEWAKKKREEEVKKAEEELAKVQEIASSLGELELEFSVKIGEKGQLFESITNQKISERLKEEGFEVKKDQIDLPEPIKELGEFPVKIHLDHNLEAEITVMVTEEK